MTADLKKVKTAPPGAKTSRSPTSPSRKEASNPQQGMTDPAASVSANTACTSPLTVTSLEAAAAATAAANDVPEVVSQVVPAVSTVQPEPVVPTVEAMLAAPMAKLSLNRPQTAVIHSPVMMDDKKMRGRTPPTEHDNRKLFVGGLPTDVSDHEFLDYFKQFGEVIDSVVIIDRITKRSRGFGFVTFANEKYANALLTAIPGKTGYVVINGKQCEVKASTPKADDGSFKHHGHHGAPGMWRSNPPHNRGYAPRQHNNAPRSGPGPMKQAVYPQPHGVKNFTIDNDFNGDVDGRNFDELYVHQPQMNASYQPMNVYNRNVPTHPLIYQNYQHAYPAAAPTAYSAYPNSAAASVPSSWDASYPAVPNQGYGQYPPNAMSGNGYYDPYAQHYSNQHGNNPNQYGGNNHMPPPMMMGQANYVNYNGYNSEEGPYASSQGDEGGFEPYDDHDASADQYE